ncbi:glycosyltransferase family 2 protein [Ruminiclostridium herbifermentans]|uniref:Glycosyltransferase family 2 protein n=1 Tax=Ruminiclostridium herbifermentans TaxID=2488810 RepID=A0A4U7J6H3_9FIRM|nr:glycosyltransferase family 2 protein [Ruminiclostridium herbifermentans]QNU66960.1 glycosyltransferase family 2 protein [Ruminiclostridium herbifermentans]
MNELTVLLPAYNEEGNLEVLINKWQDLRLPLLEKFDLSLHIVVVNDGSSDNTKNICEILEKRYSNFTLVNHTQNRGLGEALKTAITYVIKNRPNSVYTCLMDCDNTHDPKYILDMLNKALLDNDSKYADVVIASRYQRGSCVQGLSKYRIFISNCAKYVYQFLFKVKNVKDYTCGYRLYSNEILKKAIVYFGDKLVEETGFSCMAELLYKLSIIGASFSEVPFVLRYDFKQGKSKMNVFSTAVSSINLAFRLRRLRYKI